MKAYLEWNKYCLKASSWSYRIEDLNNLEIFTEWIENTGLSSNRDSESLWERASAFSDKYKEMDKISKDAYSSGFGPPITWEVLDRLDANISQEIKEMVEPYYTYDEEGKLID